MQSYIAKMQELQHEVDELQRELELGPDLGAAQRPGTTESSSTLALGLDAPSDAHKQGHDSGTAYESSNVTASVGGFLAVLKHADKNRFVDLCCKHLLA